MALGVAACGDASAPSECNAPEITSSVVRANPDNVLSAIVVARARRADSVSVRFGVTPVLDSVTPYVVTGADSSVIPVLGLLPQTAYSLRVVAQNACGTVTSESTMALSTGTLPADMPTYTTSGAQPTAGYVAFAAGSYGIVIDNTGRVVWYHRFAATPGLNFQTQPGSGHYYARPPNAAGTLGQWIEVDPLGRETRTFGCARGLQPRFHDLIALSDGGFWLMCDETKTMDLSGVGGSATAQVTGTVVQHVDKTGAAVFEWSAFDHFAITDLDPADRVGTNVNWTHGNALDLDADGNLIVSFRSLSEITKIDAKTGAVIWRMGGRAGQFAMPGSLPLFMRQHGVRLASSGELLLLDNLSDPSRSRGKRVSYATTGSPNAHMVESFSSEPPVVALLGGSTQELPDHRVLVAYGNGGRVEEYDAYGDVTWRINGNTGYIFRATRFPSLYKPGGYGR